MDLFGLDQALLTSSDKWTHISQALLMLMLSVSQSLFLFHLGLFHAKMVLSTTNRIGTNTGTSNLRLLT